MKHPENGFPANKNAFVPYDTTLIAGAKPGPSVRIQQCAVRDNGDLPFLLTGAETPPIQPESSERIFPRTPCAALHHPAALCGILSGYSFSS